jgi:transcriptional regulator with XRE-family HTH domain
MSINIGANIKARRQELGMTQRELAAKMGYTDHTTITRIEAGKTDPPQSRIAQFAKALNTTPARIMGWVDDPEPEEVGAFAAEILLQPDLYNFVQDFLSLDATDRAMVTTLVASLAAKTKKD